jgi:hypothetical protein
LQSWLAPYVAAKWKITAFKIVQDPTTGKLAATSPVRMSFKTERPLFPYREPAEQQDAKAPPSRRLLRVFFVSDTRVDATLGNAQKWHASVPWSDELTEEQRRLIVKETKVPQTEVPAKAWLTTFEDSSSPRPGKEEVFFEPAQDRSPIRPPDRIVSQVSRIVWIPADIVVLAVVMLILFTWFILPRIRRRSAEPSPP